MEWVSNNDPPLYVSEGDTWVNLSNKIRYIANVDNGYWHKPLFNVVMGEDPDLIVKFPDKTLVKRDGKWTKAKNLYNA